MPLQAGSGQPSPRRALGAGDPLRAPRLNCWRAALPGAESPTCPPLQSPGVLSDPTFLQERGGAEERGAQSRGRRADSVAPKWSQKGQPAPAPWQRPPAFPPPQKRQWPWLCHHKEGRRLWVQVSAECGCLPEAQATAGRPPSHACPQPGDVGAPPQSMSRMEGEAGRGRASTPPKSSEGGAPEQQQPSCLSGQLVVSERRAALSPSSWEAQALPWLCAGCLGRVGTFRPPAGLQFGEEWQSWGGAPSPCLPGGRSVLEARGGKACPGVGAAGRQAGWLASLPGRSSLHGPPGGRASTRSLAG